jgi:hypothetical protein
MYADSLESLFAMYIQNEGSVRNCYLTANVTYVNANGGTLGSTDVASFVPNMFVQAQGGTSVRALMNVIVDINVTNAGVAKMGVFGRCANNRPIENVVLIGGNNSSKSILTVTMPSNSILDDIQYLNCFYYDDMEDFFLGVDGQTTGTVMKPQENVAWSDATGKAYTAWDSVWTFDEEGICLCGTQVYEAV